MEMDSGKRSRENKDCLIKGEEEEEQKMDRSKIKGVAMLQDTEEVKLLKKKVEELNFQLTQLKYLSKYHNKVNEKEEKLFTMSNIKEKLSKLNTKEFFYGAETISNFLYTNVLIGTYRFNINQKSFEYATTNEDEIIWEKDEGIKLLKKYLFTPLYLRCKEIYDLEMKKLNAECFSDDKEDGFKFAEKRDEIKINIDTIMDISNEIDDSRSRRYLSLFMNNIALLTMDK